MNTEEYFLYAPGEWYERFSSLWEGEVGVHACTKRCADGERRPLLLIPEDLVSAIKDQVRVHSGPVRIFFSLDGEKPSPITLGPIGSVFDTFEKEGRRRKPPMSARRTR